jgi:hypothetical protein
MLQSMVLTHLLCIELLMLRVVEIHMQKTLEVPLPDVRSLFGPHGLVLFDKWVVSTLVLFMLRQT